MISRSASDGALFSSAAQNSYTVLYAESSMPDISSAHCTSSQILVSSSNKYTFLFMVPIISHRGRFIKRMRQIGQMVCGTFEIAD